MITTIICILALLALMKLTLKISWTVLKFFVIFFAYGFLFVMIVKFFGYTVSTPVLFVGGVVWLLTKCFGAIF